MKFHNFICFNEIAKSLIIYKISKNQLILMKFFFIYFNYYLINYAVENRDVNLVKRLLKKYCLGVNKCAVF